MHHYRKTKNTYAQHNAKDKVAPECTLCTPDTKSRSIDDTETMFVIPNRVSYDMFEARRVLDHLMIVPKRHATSINDFTDAEHLDMGKLAGKYEAQGYNVYSRGVGSSSRSVAHQHTHLIKLSQRPSKAIFFIKKPYFLLDV